MALAIVDREVAGPAQAVPHGDLPAVLRAGCREARLSSYLLVDTLPSADRLSPHLIASDWSYDMLQAVGVEAALLLADSAISTPLGTRSRGRHPHAVAALLDCPSLALLAGFGHREVHVLGLLTASRRCAMICTGQRNGAADEEALSRLQMRTCYALSSMPVAAPRLDDPLSERERECLYWVSEGKTTDEVALILEVSSNTVNSYVAHAIHKLGAANRPMAIAAAIRRGII